MTVWQLRSASIVLGLAGCGAFSACDRAQDPTAWAMVARAGSGVDVWSDSGGTRRLTLDSDRIAEVFSEPDCWAAVAVSCGWRELFPSGDSDSLLSPSRCIAASRVAAFGLDDGGPFTLESLGKVCGVAVPLDGGEPRPEAGEDIGIRGHVVEPGVLKIVTVTIDRANTHVNGQVTYPRGVDRSTARLATRLALGCAAIGNEPLAGEQLARLLADSADGAGDRLVQEVYRRPSTRREGDSPAQRILAYAVDLERVDWTVCSRY